MWSPEVMPGSRRRVFLATGQKISYADQSQYIFYIGTPEGTHYAAVLSQSSAAEELLREAPLLAAKA